MVNQNIRRTDNQRWKVPAPGYGAGNTPSWPEMINAIFDNLDTKVEIRDADANKGDYQPKDGAKFVATDTGTRYIGDGTSWNTLPTPSGSSLWDSDGSNIVPSGTEAIGDGTTDIYGQTGDFSAVNTGTIVDSDDGNMYDVGNDLAGSGIWTEDSNSPLTIEASPSGTITLSQTYDEVFCLVHSQSGTNVTGVNLQVNGDTGSNYDYEDRSGTSTTGETSWGRLFVAGRQTNVPIWLSGENIDRIGFNSLAADLGSQAVVGENNAVSTPLDSLTFTGGGNNISIVVDVLGRVV